MRRKIFNRERILKRTREEFLNDGMFSEKMIQQVGSAILDTICLSYEEGAVVDFGIGRTYLKLRKNNTKFSPSKTHSIVFRGDVRSDISGSMLDKAMEDENVYNLLYSKRGFEEKESSSKEDSEE